MTLSSQLSLFIHLFVFEGRDMQDKKDVEGNDKVWKKMCLFCFSNFLEVDSFGAESLRYWRKC